MSELVSTTDCFTEAISLLDTEKNSSSHLIGSIELSHELIQAGRESILTPGEYKAQITQTERRWPPSFFTQVAILQGYMGDSEGALRTLEGAKYHNVFDFEDVARALVTSGENPQLLFDTAGKYVDGRSDPLHVSRLLRTQRQSGDEPTSELLDKIDRSQYYDSGNHHYRNSMILRLSEGYARAGFPDEARRIWDTAQDIGYLWRPNAFSYIVLAEANAGRYIGHSLHEAVQLTEAMRPVDGEIPAHRYDPGSQQSMIFARLARAAYIAGENYGDLMEKAAEKFETEGYQPVVSDKEEVARVAVDIGYEVDRFVDLAVKDRDDIVSDEDAMRMGIIGLLDDTMIMQCELGRWEDAKRFVDGLNTQVVGPIYKAQMLARWAKIRETSKIQ